MKRIIIDHFRRRWFLWSFFCLANFILGFFLNGPGEIPPLFYLWYALWFAFLLGPTLWLSDLQKGYPRVVLGLPFTAQQIGRSLWWLSVGFASILLAGFSFLGMISARVISFTNNFSFGAWMLYVFFNAIMYGMVFGLLCVAPPRPLGHRRQKTGGYSNRLTMPLLVLVGIYFFCKDGYPTVIKLTAFFLVSGTLSILGWFRAEGLIVDYGEYRAASQQPKNLQGQFKVPNGYGGISYIFGIAFFRVWTFGIIFLIVMNLLELFTKHQFNWHHLTQCFSNGSFFPLFFGIFIFLPFALSQNLRLLRTMPVSSARLAATLLSVYILPLLTLCLAITALAWTETRSAECASFFKLELLAVAPVSVFIAVSIWNTEANFIKTILLVIVILATFAPALYQLTCMDSHGLPLWFIILFNVVIVTISYWSTCQILAKSSSAYRARQNVIGNGWSWGRR